MDSLNKTQNNESTFILFGIKNNDSNYINPIAYIPIDSAYLKSEQNIFKQYVDLVGKDSYANLIATIGLILTLLLFMFQNWRDRIAKKKAMKENWYLSIIVQPNLENINSFYRTIEDKLASNVRTLKATTNPNSIIKKKIASNRDIQNEKKNFFNNFVTIVQAYDNNLANQIDEYLNNLDDYCTEVIDSFSTCQIENSKRRVHEFKAELTALLYNGISKN